MGTDYRAYYGIGYKVCVSDEIADTDDLENGLGEYVDCECGGGFNGFETGNAWSGVVDGVYLSVRDPFKDGLDLTAVKERLDKEMARLKLEPESEFGEIGGLLVF